MEPFVLTSRHVRLVFQAEAPRSTDPTIRAALEKQRRDGFAWRWEGLEGWSTEAIFQRLAELGVATSPEQFPDQAAAAGSCERVAAAWLRDLPRPPEGYWRDFPDFAAEALWARFTPELPCPELVADRISEALEPHHRGAQGWPADPDAELVAAEALAALLEAVPPGQRSARFQEVERATDVDLHNWLHCSTWGLALRFPRQMTRVLHALESVYPPQHSIHTDLADGLAQGGHLDEAREVLRRVAPQDAWEHANVAEVYLRLRDPHEALRHQAEALRSAKDARDWDQLRERIGMDLASAGDPYPLTDLDPLARRPPDAVPPPSPLIEPRAAAAAPPPPVSGSRSPTAAVNSRKPGRNDPCSCGSGLKYKKCCLKGV